MQNIIQTMYEIGLGLLTGIGSIWEFITTPINDYIARLPSWIYTIIRPLSEDLFSISILEFVFFGGIIFFVLYTVAKWVLDLIT